MIPPQENEAAALLLFLTLLCGGCQSDQPRQRIPELCYQEAGQVICPDAQKPKPKAPAKPKKKEN